MSEPYQIFVLIPEGIPQRIAVYKTHEIVISMDGEIHADDSLLILNDIEDQEFEPYYIEDVDQALESLAGWKTSGSIVYFIPGATTFTYLSALSDGNIQSIKISILESSFLKIEKSSANNTYKDLAAVLHREFAAKRTIMNWGIEYQGFDWQEEIERLKMDCFDRSYSLVDLHRR